MKPLFVLLALAFLCPAFSAGTLILADSTRNISTQVVHGSLTVDFRAAQNTVSAAFTVKGGSLTLVFSEDAAVTVIDTGSIFSVVSGDAFYREGSMLVHEGCAPASRVTLTLTGGNVRLICADSATPLDSVVSRIKTLPLASLSLLQDHSDFLRYNRAEGLYLGAAFDSRRVTPDNKALLLSAGYAAGARLIEYSAGALVGFTLGRMPAEGRLFHSRKADTEDKPVMGAGENTFQMFLFGDDYFDYYNCKRTDLSGKLEPMRGLTLSASAGSAYYFSMERSSVFYLFGHDSDAVRKNPEVNKGEDRYLRAGVEWNDVSLGFPRSGVFARAEGQYSGGRIKSEFTYRKATLDLKAYRPLSGSTEVAFGLFTGEVSGKAGHQAIAPQKLFDIGGTGTVRGLPFRADTNWLDKDRMVLLSIETRMRAGRILKGFSPLLPGLFNERSRFLFAFDAGSAWNTSLDNIGFDNLFTDMRLNRFHKSVTLGLSSPNENVRLELSRAFRGDKSQTLDAVTLRFNPGLN